jgi:uncharacterized protein (TIGR02145 family)
VVIGTQTWFAKNLNYEVEGSKCYGDDPANCGIYGRLYDWETAKTVCPSGWHLPSDEEWDNLTSTCNIGSDAGKFKATSGWNGNGNGTDDYGFSALPGGNRSDGYFRGAGGGGYWWSATEYTDIYASFRSMFYDDSNVSRNSLDKSYLFSVRCLQD